MARAKTTEGRSPTDRSAIRRALSTPKQDCIRYLVARRWSNGAVCPRCGNPKVYALASVTTGNANSVRRYCYRFSHLTGTIFENTNKPLKFLLRHSPDVGQQKGYERAPNLPLYGLRQLFDGLAHVPQGPRRDD